jgi:hypothetical protein
MRHRRPAVRADRDGGARPLRAIRLLGAELAAGHEPAAARSRLQSVGRSADAGLIGARGFSAVVFAQLRSTVVDLLAATGMAGDDALAAVPLRV